MQLKTGNVSMSLIAEKLNVSINTVSKALRGKAKVSETTRQKILETAKALDYRPNCIARALVNGKTGLIGAIFSSYGAQFFGNLLSGVEAGAQESGFNVLTTHIPDEEPFEKKVEAMLRYHPEGIIATPYFNNMEDSLYAGLKAENIKFVAASRKIKIPGVCSVYSDDYTGALEAMRYLIDCGHRNIIFVKYFYDNESSGQMRYNGYLGALKEAGISVRSEYIIKEDRKDKQTPAIIFDRIKKRPEVSAVFCCTDPIAAEFMLFCRVNGIKVPEDISIIGYGDNIKYAELMQVPLTTVNQNSFLMGQTAIKYLNMLINGEPVPEDVLVPTEMIIRESVKKQKSVSRRG